MASVLPRSATKGKPCPFAQREIHPFVTFSPPSFCTYFVVLDVMTSHVWDFAIGPGYRPPAGRPVRRKTVSQILRAAYRKHVRDRHTRLAIKRCLR
jgi:hypothetical protein